MTRRYNKRRGRKKNTISRQIKREIVKQAEKKSYNSELSATPVPVYIAVPPSLADIPFLAFDLIQGQKGLQSNGRVGAKTNGLLIDFRSIMSFNDSITIPDNTAVFVQMFVIAWPEKLTVSSAYDMNYVLRELEDTGVTSGFPQLYNSPYEIASKQTYDILMRKQFTMVKDTSSALKVINKKFYLNRKNRGDQEWDRASSGIQPPQKGSIGVYVMASSATIAGVLTSLVNFSYSSKYIFTDS